MQFASRVSAVGYKKSPPVVVHERLCLHDSLVLMLHLGKLSRAVLCNEMIGVVLNVCV